MEKIFRDIRKLIAKGDVQLLESISIAIPERFNWVREVFENINLRDYPEYKAIIWTDGKQEAHYTFQAIGNWCNRFLNFLRRSGVQEQDIIFSQIPLLPANWICYLTAIKGGFQLIPSATILNTADIVYRFGKLLPRVAIADYENAAKIDEAEKISGQSIPLKIIVNDKRPGWVSFDDISGESEEAMAADTKPGDPLFLFFTSGTTGLPKVVTHTHLSYPLGHLTTASWIGMHPGDLHYNIAQPGWAKFAWSSLFAPWNMGACIFAFHPNGRFIAKDHLAMMEKYRVSTFCAPPTVLRMLILENLKEYQLSIRECVSAGEPLNPEVIDIWERGTGLTIRDGYGQTESSCMIANLPAANIRPGSMGKATFLYDVVIADEDGREAGIDQEGNICVKTNTGKPNGIFSDYFDDDVKKQEVFKHGLYYTGDKAYKDGDGYIWFVGRDDDVIKSSGYRIGPFEVESALLEHESVIESAVVGSPHPIKGLEIKAFVVLAQGNTPGKELAENIFAFSKEKLAPYKIPRIIQFVNELPKTISGKIRRIELRATEAQHKAKKISIPHEFFYSS